MLIENLDKSKKQVLVVEDSKIMLKIYQTQFSNSAHLKNHQLSTSTNALDGFEWLKKFATFHKSLPKLIILDWIMPGKYDGFGLLTLIKKHDYYKTIPVIMVSCIEDKSKILNAMKVGVNDYLMKPLNIHNLINKVIKYTNEAP